MSMLDELLAGTRHDVAERESETPLEEVERRARNAADVQDIGPVLRSRGLHVVGDVLRAVPGSGPLTDDFDAADIAEAMVKGGAVAVSVVTEERKFGGSLHDALSVREAVDVPVIRRDFHVNDYHVIEARALGADAVTLQAAALSQGELTRLSQVARDWGMTPIVEVHDVWEMDRALASPVQFICVDAVNWRTLSRDVDTVALIASKAPKNRTVLVQSCVHAPSDVSAVVDMGVAACVVGEGAVSSATPADVIRSVVEAVRLA